MHPDIRCARVTFIVLLMSLVQSVHGGSDGATDEPVIPPGERLVEMVAEGHPRLLLDDGGFDAVRAAIREERVPPDWVDALRRRADTILDQPPSTYEIPDGLRLLSTSRRVVDRVYTLALMFRMTARPAYLERCWQELQAAAEFPDWNARHFLDTAEMTHAFAIAYDWLYDSWTPEQRQVIADAIVKHGLEPARGCYNGKSSYGWWTRSAHNWNQVCNGGIALGALAIAKERPELAGEILHAALESLKRPMRRFAPDGGWDEGPGYWGYATTYNVLLLASLETSLGTDFGFADYPGFDKTGWFAIYITGPLNRTFNFADGTDHLIRAPQLFWMARRFDEPAFAQYQMDAATGSPLDIVWLTQLESKDVGPSAPTPALDRYFKGIEVATMRSAWNDRDAIFIGFKGGDNKANHSNLDLGTFVLDALGVRWALDLGRDNYNLPGYFGGKRWTYYRLRAESHNTLVINPGKGPDQSPRAEARITQFDSNDDRVFAVADLSGAYGDSVSSVERGIQLFDGRRRVLVQDEITPTANADAWWFMHTQAEITLDDAKRTAMLVQDGKRLAVRLLEPRGAEFMVKEARPLPSSPNPEGQAENKDVRSLAIHFESVDAATRIVVLIEPIDEKTDSGAPSVVVRPLDKW